MAQLFGDKYPENISIGKNLWNEYGLTNEQWHSVVHPSRRVQGYVHGMKNHLY